MTINAAALLRNAINAPAMRYRDFRFLFVSSVFESMGFMGEQVVLGWLALELTGSPFMVGAILGAKAIPFFFLGIIAGTISDMVSRRNLMRALSIGMIVVTSTVGLLIMLDLIQVWHLFVFAVVGGCFATLYQTSRQSFAFDVVGPSNLVSGLAFVSLGMRIGGLIGSLAVGFLIEDLGAESAYFLLASGYFLSVMSLLFVRTRGASAARERQPVLQNLKEFGIELRRNNTLLILVIIVAGVEVMGFTHSALLPSLARDELNVGADGLGILNASRSVGAILAILVLSPFGEIPNKGKLLLAVITIFGSSLVLLGLSTTFIIALIAVAVIGGMMALSDLLSQSIIQNVVPNELRGRAMGAWVVGVGTAPAGNLQIGALASAFGVTIALAGNGLGLVVLAMVIFALYPRLRRL